MIIPTFKPTYFFFQKPTQTEHNIL